MFFIVILRSFNVSCPKRKTLWNATWNLGLLGFLALSSFVDVEGTVHYFSHRASSNQDVHRGGCDTTPKPLSAWRPISPQRQMDRQGRPRETKCTSINNKQ
jgi:hypothetical protein